MRGLARGFFVCLGVLWLGSPAAGDFNPEVLVSSGNGGATAPAIEVDPFDNVFVVYLEGGEVWIRRGPFFEDPPVAITTNGLGHESPQVRSNNQGELSVVYEQEDIAPGAEGNEILITSNPGGPFGTAVNISGSFRADHDPAISGGFESGSKNVVWVREDGGSQVAISVEVSSAMLIASGAEPRLATGDDGCLHVVYTRGGDVFYRADLGNGFGPEITVANSVEIEQSPDIQLDSANLPQVVYESGGEIFFTRDQGSGFEPPANLAGSGTAFSSPRLLVGAGNGVQICFTDGNDLYRVVGSGTVFGPPENLTNTPEAELDPQYGVDSLGYLHVAYTRAGDVLYRNEVPPPVVAFSYDPALGEVPLEVQFTDDSSGVVTHWQWDFGDGTTSSQELPLHLYEQSGNYGVQLTVRGPGGVDSVFVPSAIQVLNPSNFMTVPDSLVFQGQPNVTIPVLGTHPDPAQGYQIAAKWDDTLLHLQELTIQNTSIASLLPEFLVLNIDQNGAESSFVVGLIIDVLEPFDGRTLPPGVDQRLVNMIVDVNFAAPPNSTTVVDLAEEGVQDPLIFNIFTVAGISVLPVLTDGTVTILPFELPPPFLFIRGDVDLSQSVEITDAVNLLGFLFSGGEPPFCPDAADANDSGTLDLADAVFILNLLFSNGIAPPVPYPTLGLDPTPDPLGDC